MRDPNKNTKFSFFCYEHESIDLKIRLRYDGLKQSEFFRSLLLKYINKDPVMLRMVHDIKQQQNILMVFSLNFINHQGWKDIILMKYLKWKHYCPFMIKICKAQG